MTTSCTALSPDAFHLLRDAAEWQLVSMLLEYPQPGWIEQVSTLAKEVACPSLKRAVDAAHQEALPGLYHSTFGPGGPAAPREVSHRRDVLPGASLAELRDLYQAFAYEPSLDEPPDHVAVEAGFVAYLRFKQAYAVARGDDEQALICANAINHVVAEHLGRIAGPLATSLASSGVAYLSHAAGALRAAVACLKSSTALPGMEAGPASESE